MHAVGLTIPSTAFASAGQVTVTLQAPVVASHPATSQLLPVQAAAQGARHVPVAHERPPPHVLLLQHGCPSAPQLLHVPPDVQTRVDPAQGGLTPPQHVWFKPPQGAQLPPLQIVDVAVHAFPGQHG
jgi:hypothetical protein